MKQEVLIVLGAPNSNSENLSLMSLSRLNFCKTRYAPGKLVLCTGGWGEHFNTTPRSHASYAKDYLLKIGFLEDDFLPNALSQNTVDDAVKIKTEATQEDEISFIETSIPNFPLREVTFEISKDQTKARLHMQLALHEISILMKNLL